MIAETFIRCGVVNHCTIMGFTRSRTGRPTSSSARRAWNGTLFLYSHGYVVPGSANPATDVGDPVTGAWLLGHGYALAGSSYATTGWAIQQALPDQIDTLNAFDGSYGKPTHHRLGAFARRHHHRRAHPGLPDRFSAALPMCGVLSGGVATWNTALDAEFAFQQLIDPAVQVVNITNPTANLPAAEAAAAERSRPRRAGPGSRWSPRSATRQAGSPRCRRNPPRPTTPPRKPTSSVGAEVTFPFVFDFRAELEARAGGNPSWNTGVNYFSRPGQVGRLERGHRAVPGSGLNLTGDLHKLNTAPRITPDPRRSATWPTTSRSTGTSRCRC